MPEQRRRRMTLAATSLGSALAAIDTSVVIVALPTIERDLGLGFTGQQWVVLSYSVALAALYLVAGAAGDRFGRRRMFLWGALGFAAASALAGAAPDESLLVTARALQGVTGAFLTTNSLALLPLAAVTLALLLGVREPQSSGAERRPFDLAGAALAASGFGLLTFGLVQGQESGYPRVAWALALGAAALIAFPVVERRRCSPMLPLELFARRSFAAANLETFLVYGALGGLVFFFILFLQFIGFSAFEAGLINLPVSVIIIALSPTLGRRADARGPRALLTLGPVLMAAGMAFLLGVSDRSDFWVFGPPGLVLFALGLAHVVAPITSTALASAPARLSGVAAGVNQTVSRVGNLVAVALAGVVVALVFEHVTGDPSAVPFQLDDTAETLRDGSTAAFRAAIGVCIAFALAGAAVAATMLRNERTETAA